MSPAPVVEESTESLAATAAALAEEIVVGDTAAFVEALEIAVEVAATSVDEPAVEVEAGMAAEAVETPSAECPAPSGQPPRKPRRLSMAVIVARGADF